MNHGYIVTQVVYLIELLEQRRLPDFCENIDLDNWNITVRYRISTISTSFPQVDD